MDPQHWDQACKYRLDLGPVSGLNPAPDLDPKSTEPPKKPFDVYRYLVP